MDHVSHAHQRCTGCTSRYILTLTRLLFFKREIESLDGVMWCAALRCWEKSRWVYLSWSVGRSIDSNHCHHHQQLSIIIIHTRVSLLSRLRLRRRQVMRDFVIQSKRSQWFDSPSVDVRLQCTPTVTHPQGIELLFLHIAYRVMCTQIHHLLFHFISFQFNILVLSVKKWIVAMAKINSIISCALHS